MRAHTHVCVPQWATKYTAFIKTQAFSPCGASSDCTSGAD